MMQSLILILILGSSPALAQSTFGTIVGTVRDPSGALTPSVVITVENTGTSVRRSTMADESASYSFLKLEPGTYKVIMMAPGFQVAEYTNIQLLGRQTIRIDGVMAVASQTETVSVVALRLRPSSRRKSRTPYRTRTTAPHPSERLPTFKPQRERDRVRFKSVRV
jgi:hypothetical protein